MRDAFGVERSDISKGEYDDAQEIVQRNRRKANRRHTAAAPLMVAGTAPLTMNAIDAATGGDIIPWAVRRPAASAYRKADINQLEHTLQDHPKRASAWRGVKNAAEYSYRHPRKATMLAGAPALGAGLGLTAAKLGHNARSNQVARSYNKKNKNSKIKIVPITAKNRF